MKVLQIALFLALQNAVSFAQHGWGHYSPPAYTNTAVAPPANTNTAVAPPANTDTAPAPPATQATAPPATQATGAVPTAATSVIGGNTLTNTAVAGSGTAVPSATATGGSGGGGSCHQLNFVGPGAPASTCVPGGTNPGITIGGNEGTKVEIYAAPGGGATGSGGTLNVLDVSVCAGYSVPVQCTVSGGEVAGSPLGLTAGGSGSFGTCPNNAAATDSGGVCINNESHNTGSDNVDAFFKQPGYWYWDNDGTPHVNWIGYQTITCTIGGGSAKRDLETNDTTIQRREGTPIIVEPETSGVAKAHFHKTRPHARALGSLVQVS